VSGGCDSSFTLYKAVEMGLNPLAVSYVNSWETDISTQNVYNICKALGVKYEAYVVDHREVNDLALSFMKAGVVDIEIPTDLGIQAVLYMAAEKHGVKYILNGHSYKTEGMSPLDWTYMDGRYIKDVHSRFGKHELKTYPILTLRSFLKYARGIRRIRPLWYLDYNKNEARDTLSSIGWQWYGGHHMENTLTIYAQNFWMPLRHGVDQRWVEYSAMARSGNLSRKEALDMIEKPHERNPEIVMYLKKRLGLSNYKYNKLWKAPIKTYRDYKTYNFKLLKPYFWWLHKTNKIPTSFYKKYVCN